MSLKINFETDIKGFQRVEAALTTQKKLIDESADAMKRLANAKEGMSKTEDDTKGNESLRVTAKRIEDLTGALSTLTKSSSGFKGFIDLFGGFSKQMAEFNKGASNQVLETMNKQIDLLKTSIISAGQTLKTVQNEAKQHRSAGRTESALEKEDEAASIGTRMISENSLLRNLQVSKFMNQPVGSFLGGGMAGAGPSITGIGSKVIAGIGLTAAAAAGVNMASQAFLNYSYSGERGESATFNRQMAVSGAAAGGNIGRQFMLSRGLGVEAGFRDSTGLDEYGGLSGGFGMRAMGERFGIGSKYLIGAVTGNYKSTAELYEERATQLSAMDQKRTAGLNESGTRLNTLLRDSTYDSMARKMGNTNTLGMLENINQSGATQDEALGVLRSMSAYGTFGAFNQASQAVTVGSTPEDRFYNDPRALFAAQRKLGVSGNTVSELGRQSYYRPLNQAMTDTGDMLGLAGTRTLAANQMMADFASSMQAKNQLGSSDMTSVAGLAVQVSGDINRSGKVDAITGTMAGIDAQKYVQNSGGNAGSLASDAQISALHSLGVRNPMAVQALQRLIADGQHDKAASVVSKYSGIDIENVKGRINQAAQVPFDLVKQLVEGGEEDKRFSGILKDETGVGLAAASMAGSSTSALALGIEESNKKKLVFNKKEFEVPYAPTKPTDVGDTSSDQLAAAEAGVSQKLLEGTRRLMADMGDKVGTLVVNEIAKGYVDMGNTLYNSIRQLSTEAKDKASESAREEGFTGTRNMPTTAGGQGG